jgi:hypothetical protein
LASSKLPKKRITTEFFDVYNHLWRDGGANCKLEFKKWEEEQEEACALVTKKKKVAASKQVHFASPIRQHSPKLKYAHSLNFHNVKIGCFDCPVNEAQCPWIKPYLTKDRSSIPVKHVWIPQLSST